MRVLDVLGAPEERRGDGRGRKERRDKEAGGGRGREGEMAVELRIITPTNIQHVCRAAHPMNTVAKVMR